MCSRKYHRLHLLSNRLFYSHLMNCLCMNSLDCPVRSSNSYHSQVCWRLISYSDEGCEYPEYLWTPKDWVHSHDPTLLSFVLSFWRRGVHPWIAVAHIGHRILRREASLPATGCRHTENLYWSVASGGNCVGLPRTSRGHCMIGQF